MRLFGSAIVAQCYRLTDPLCFGILRALVRPRDVQTVSVLVQFFFANILYSPRTTCERYDWAILVLSRWANFPAFGWVTLDRLREENLGHCDWVAAAMGDQGMKIVADWVAGRSVPAMRIPHFLPETMTRAFLDVLNMFMRVTPWR